MASLLLLVLLLLVVSVRGKRPQGAGGWALAPDFGALPLRFEPNRGQLRVEADYVVRGLGYDVWLEGGAMVVAFPSPEEGEETDGSLLRMHFIDAHPGARVAAGERLPGVVNYYRGPDPSNWHEGIPTYAGARYENIYDGVDVVYYGEQGALKYDLLIAPHTNPSVIAIGFEGAISLSLAANGDLLVDTPHGQLVQQKPYVYQALAGRRQRVDAAYRLDSGRVTFELDAYDPTRPLIIDPPTLLYSTYLGTSNRDQVNDIAVDASGNVYVAMRVEEGDSPFLVNKATLLKLNPTTTQILYETVLESTDSDNADVRPYSIAVDQAGAAYVTGETGDSFPVTGGVFQPTYGGSAVASSDAFVAKLDAGGQVIYASYLGGRFSDKGYGIAVDANGIAYVVGETVSSDFPTQSAYQVTQPGGGNDAFVTKVNASGATLLFSTYLGGADQNDRARDVAVGSNSLIYVTGTTSSFDFPTQSGHDISYNGAQDTFVTVLSQTGLNLVFSTFLGGSINDYPHSLALDSNGNAYVFGYTTSDDFPLKDPLEDRFDTEDYFVSKLNDAGFLVYSTYLTGSPNGNLDRMGKLAVDSRGRAYIAGDTSGQIPVKDPIQTTRNGPSDAFIMVLNEDGIDRLFSTYFGGSSSDSARGIGLDAAGNIYVGGWTDSSDFRTTQGVVFPDSFGSTDGMLFKLSSLDSAPPPTDIPTPTITPTPTVTPTGTATPTPSPTPVVGAVYGLVREGSAGGWVDHTGGRYRHNHVFLLTVGQPVTMHGDVTVEYFIECGFGQRPMVRHERLDEIVGDATLAWEDVLVLPCSRRKRNSTSPWRYQLSHGAIGNEVLVDAANLGVDTAEASVNTQGISHFMATRDAVAGKTTVGTYRGGAAVDPTNASLPTVNLQPHQQVSVTSDGVSPVGEFSPPTVYLPLLLRTAPAATLYNGDFEAGPVAWSEYSAQDYALILNDLPAVGVTTHSGSWAAWLGGADDELSIISQQVTVPVALPTLSFWLWIASEDVCGNDEGRVTVSPSGGTPVVVDAFPLCDDQDTHGWVQRVVDLSAWAGASVELAIVAETNSSLNSNLFIDDVSF